MAKDGTNRGGVRPGAGRRVKPLADKISEGNLGKRPIEVMEFKNMESLQGEEMPKPSKMLSAKQRNGKKLIAAAIYKKTWAWLDKRGCAVFVSPDLLERYAMSAARWIQCEEAVTEWGFLAKHPTTGNAIQSPYVAMSQSYMAQTNHLWDEIYLIVKENCAGEYKGESPQDDIMERLLRTQDSK
ncbi:P27 family phage terminase small subunit [uncultured Dialister sp.]|uniref:P27 family phage terminase small subunit n=1 Tax=uncultured Dialister sp. TaxID=278064 RepID=UPI0026604F3C|nr:P27 family phage terminase small subunit [uncultured Dialister sp.]